ncbi:MAG: ATP-binding cassette domain-containing protein [Treponema sp.]|nr:ATP-binding cassette domain-containing protein [Treponema sp.]
MIEIEKLSKTFYTEGGPVNSLKNVSLQIEDGDIFGIIGMSGAGKSTLVRSINMLEKPTSGTVRIDGTDLSEISEKDLRRMRRKITMIFQSFNLLSQRNCLKNVCFPLELAGVKKAGAEKRALELLELVGLKDKAFAYPSQLSGGQQQRVAIARALASSPKVLLCDEATSALDPLTTNSILELIQKINRELKITVVVITHQMSVVEKICNKVAILEHGSVVETGSVQEIFSHPKSEAAKKLVFPENDAGVAGSQGEDVFALAKKNPNTVRVVFNGAEAANRPLVSQLASEKGILSNIAYAQTKSVGEKAFGAMFLSYSSREDMEQAISFFKSVTDITVEVL